MSEALTAPVVRPKTGLQTPLVVAVAWRNLWRNRRRTWLTAGSIAFAIFLVVLAQSFQYGAYGAMIENATTLLSGHAQVQNQRYIDNDRFEYTIDDVTELVRVLEDVGGVASVAPRVEAFALVSADERSFGAQILGVELAREQQTVRVFTDVVEGRMFAGDDEAVVGTGLARNLELEIGGELVVLGTAKQGGVAAFVFDVVGIVSSGVAELDRVLVAAPLSAVQAGYDLGDEAHTLVIRTTDLDDSAETVAAIRGRLGDRYENLAVRNWNEVMPDVEQAIEIDKLGGQLFYGIIMVVVAFSVVNTLIMTVFERVREFGMLLAIGMRPGRIQGLLQLESFFMWVLGAVLGLLLATIVVGWFGSVGLYLGEDLEEYAAQLHMPSRMYPALSWDAVLPAPIVLLIATQIAAVLPGLRIRGLKPVEALRTE